jgi:hypothetical protein
MVRRRYDGKLHVKTKRCLTRWTLPVSVGLCLELPWLRPRLVVTRTAAFLSVHRSPRRDLLTPRYPPSNVVGIWPGRAMLYGLPRRPACLARLRQYPGEPKPIYITPWMTPPRGSKRALRQFMIRYTRSSKLPMKYREAEISNCTVWHAPICWVTDQVVAA